MLDKTAPETSVGKQCCREVSEKSVGKLGLLIWMAYGRCLRSWIAAKIFKCILTHTPKWNSNHYSDSFIFIRMCNLQPRVVEPGCVFNQGSNLQVWSTHFQFWMLFYLAWKYQSSVLWTFWHWYPQKINQITPVSTNLRRLWKLTLKSSQLLVVSVSAPHFCLFLCDFKLHVNKI